MENNIIASVIVLNYFGENFIEKTIESLINLNFPQSKLEIIIVDNNSQDKSQQIINKLAQSHSNITPIFSQTNVGFSSGNNLGISQAKGEYIILLNNDCIVDKDWLKELINTANKDKHIFAVNSKIMLGNTNKIQNAGIMVFQDGYGRDIGSVIENNSQDYEEDKGQYNNEKEVYAACGAAVLYRKSILDKIGYLDENFFMYYEDVEISERARLHGYKIIYAPKAVVHHSHAASSNEWSSFFLYNVERNRLLHMLYHFPLSVFLKQFCKFTVTAKLRFIRSLLKQEKINTSWQYIKVINNIFFLFPIYFVRRVQLHKKISQESIKNNYLKILSGFWYFN